MLVTYVTIIENLHDNHDNSQIRLVALDMAYLTIYLWYSIYDYNFLIIKS
jgi:hypothetical protein